MLLDGRDEAVFGVGGGEVEVEDGQSCHTVGDPGGEVVDDEDVVSAFGEQSYDVRADVACASRDQNSHVSPSSVFRRGAAAMPEQA